MSWVFDFVRKMVAALKNSTDNLKKISINCKKKQHMKNSGIRGKFRIRTYRTSSSFLIFLLYFNNKWINAKLKVLKS